MKRFFSLLAVLFMTGAAAFAAEPQTTHKLALPDSLQQVELGIYGSTFTVKDASSWKVTSKAGKALGILVSTEELGKKIQGFSGPTPVFVLIDPQNIVKKIAVGENYETPEYLEMAADGLFPKWYGLDVKKASSARVDAVSGASFSSNALILNVWKALETYMAGMSK